jgi:hypothetical protein
MAARSKASAYARPRARAVALALALGCATAAGSAHADDDLSVYRQQFKEGLDAYAASRFADAILKWQPIYEQLGPKKAYRLSFNLARAYEAYGDLTRAAERYESYLAEVDARRAAGEPLEPVVEKQEAEARESLGQLVAKQARIRIRPAAKPVMVQVGATEPRVGGFTAYVRPGKHTVTFNPGTAAAVTREVVVEEGKLVELDPPPPPDETRIVVVQPKTRTETVHPFPSWVVWTGVGVTLASAIIPAVAYRRAMDTKSRYDAAQSPDDKQRLFNQYEKERNGAYVSWAFPIAFGVATAGLVTWYALGTTKREVPIAPSAATATIGVAAGPASIDVHGTF